MTDPREATSLLSVQWSGYAERHRDRTNLVLHAITVPLFMAGTLALLVGPWVGPWWSFLPGLLSMMGAVGAQGGGHRREMPPAPFRSPLEAVLRLTAEQWVTFPRFVLSGGFARAWRDAA